jgi:hypothetical protein
LRVVEFPSGVFAEFVDESVVCEVDVPVFAAVVSDDEGGSAPVARVVGHVVMVRLPDVLVKLSLDVCVGSCDSGR